MVCQELKSLYAICYTPIVEADEATATTSTRPELSISPYVIKFYGKMTTWYYNFWLICNLRYHFYNSTPTPGTWYQKLSWFASSLFLSFHIRCICRCRLWCRMSHFGLPERWDSAAYVGRGQDSWLGWGVRFGLRCFESVTVLTSKEHRTSWCQAVQFLGQYWRGNPTDWFWNY